MLEQDETALAQPDKRDNELTGMPHFKNILFLLFESPVIQLVERRIIIWTMLHIPPFRENDNL